jgi:phosphoserine phosphatase RsbX
VRLMTDYLIVPRDGESASGDAAVVRRQGDYTLLAVVDALGHGPEAAKVADASIEEINAAPLEAGVSSLMDAIHARLRKTRGAAATLCLTHDKEIEICAVGNVAVRSSKSDLPLMLTPGVLGTRLVGLRVFRAPLADGDRLVIFTDGVSSQLTMDELRGLDPGAACRALMQRHRNMYDDATVLVADVRSQ